MHPPEQFRTERLRLRRIGPDDVTALFRAYGADPDATRYLSWRTHDSAAQTQEFVDHALEAWEDGSEFTWVLIPEEREAPAGAISAVPGPHGVEIGYVLAPELWGRGLMVEALRALMAWLRDQPGVFRIWAYCAAEHARSARVLERGGMTYEALLRRWVTLPNLSDEPCDVKVFAWIRPAA